MPSKKVGGLDLFLAAYVLLIWLVWDKCQKLGLTCALMALAIPCLGYFHAPQEALPPVPEPHFSGRGSQILLGLAGLVLAWFAARAGLAGRLGPMAGWMLGSALAFRFTVLEPLPVPKGRTLFSLALGVVVLGALFRLWKAGAVPVGICGTDEIQIWGVVRSFLNGARPTYSDYSALGADGAIPIYMLMAGLKAFGFSMLGWRLEGILCGIALTALCYRLGKESLNAWVGLGAAFFWAVSVWPVTITRAVYYMSETTFLVVACLTLLTLALKKGGAWRFAAAGLFWAFCFNAYPAARVMLALVPWLYALLWLFERTARPALKRSTGPLVTGFLVGITPLALWLYLAYPDSMKAYFAAFTAPQESGVLASPSLLGKMNEAFKNTLHAFPDAWRLLIHGADYASYFPTIYPMLHPWLLGLAVLGACVALARFRNAFCSFLLYWWFVGMLPALGSGGTSDRRILMALPPTLLLAGLGCDTLARWGRATLGKSRRAAFILAAIFLSGAAAYAGASWRDYFDRNERDPALMIVGQAADTQVCRAVHAAIGPRTLLISTWKSQNGVWNAPFYDAYGQAELGCLAPGIDIWWYQRNPIDNLSDFAAGGFMEPLDWAWKMGQPTAPHEKQADVLVLLTPFYEYLAPGLKAIGAESVAEVHYPLSSMGPLQFPTMALLDKHPDLYASLLRIRGLDAAKLALYARRARIPFTVQELQPPRGWTREKVRYLDTGSATYLRLSREYREDQGWSGVGKVRAFSTDDPWFWSIIGDLPVSATTPYRVRLRAGLMIPADGDYSFGASASVLTTIRIDHRTVFERDPFVASKQVPGDSPQRGFLGTEVHLTRGEHSLFIEQAVLSRFPGISEVLRPVWKAPGQKMETLPLELLRQ